MGHSFLPSINGFRFANDWPSEPIFKISFAGVGEIEVGNVSLGLCGGMTFGCLDYYLAGKLPPDSTECPPRDDGLYGFLISRQIGSIDLPLGCLRLWNWARWSDQRLLEMTRAEADLLSSAIASRPIPLMLTRAHSLDPRALARNHQVLAYEVMQERSPDGATIVRVYDPNCPLDDEVTVTLDRDGVRHRDYSLRGFYVSRHSDYDGRLP